jgi:hypothetical protein
MTNDGQRHKITYDLPQDISQLVSNVARGLDVSSSDVAGYLLRQALACVDMDQMRAMRVPSLTPCRWGFTLRVVRQRTTRQGGLQDAMFARVTPDDHGN